MYISLIFVISVIIISPNKYIIEKIVLQWIDSTTFDILNRFDFQWITTKNVILKCHLYVNYLGTMPWEGECGKTSTLKLTKLPNMAWTWFSKRSFRLKSKEFTVSYPKLTWKPKIHRYLFRAKPLSLTLLSLCTSAAHVTLDMTFLTII